MSVNKIINKYGASVLLTALGVFGAGLGMYYLRDQDLVKKATAGFGKGIL